MSNSPVDPLAAFWDALGDEDAWQHALDEGAADLRQLNEIPYEPELFDPDLDHLPDDQLRAQYADEKQNFQREVSDRAAAARKALAGMQRLPAKQQRKRERFRCFCPNRPHGCRLVTAYAWTGPIGSPLHGRETLLLVATRKKHDRACLPAWNLQREEPDPDEWLPVACPHGSGRFPTHVPGEVTHAVFTATSGIHSRIITDLLGVAGVAWTATTLMLRT